MLLVKDFTQSRLAVFVADAGDGAPVRRLPVYAEIVISPSDAEPELSPFDNETMKRLARRSPELHRIIRQSLIEWLDEEWVRQNPERFEGIVDSVLGFVEDLVGVDPLPDDAVERVDRAVENRAHEYDVPPPAPEPPAVERVLPLGLLATDHAGFVSFDLDRVDVRGLVPQAAQSATQIDFRVYPGLLEERRVGVVAQNRIADDAIVARIELTDA